MNSLVCVHKVIDIDANFTIFFQSLGKGLKKGTRHAMEVGAAEKKDPARKDELREAAAKVVEVSYSC